MLVKCIKNKSEFVSNWRRNNSGPLEDTLIVGKYYTVYGIVFSGMITYYELLTFHSKYTFSYPSFLFEVTDNRLSNEFCIGNIETGDNKIVPFISFKEWVDDKNFYSRLVDRADREVKIFNKYIQLLEFEYAHPDIKEPAGRINETWVQCPKCADAWELECLNSEMIICPNCKATLLNPFKVR